MNSKTISPRPQTQKQSVPPLRSRILTTHFKRYHPFWRERTVLLPGWQTEVERAQEDPSRNTYRRALYWAWKLFAASRDFDAVVTGTERMALMFALLQRLTRRQRVPQVLIECLWHLPDTPVRRFLERMKLRLLIGSVSRIVLWHRFQIEAYSQALGVPAERFAWIPFHSTLYGEPHPVSEGDYIFAGGDSSRDYATLVESVRGLPYRVVIAALYRHHFRGLDLPKNVEILTTSREQFFHLMAGAGVVVLTLRGGLLHSGGEQTYLNAMLMGKPVIVADDCGADEHITHGVNGLLLPPGDVAGLRQGLQTLMENRSLARLLGQNAKLVAARYTPERFFESVFALVEDCVARRKHG